MLHQGVLVWLGRHVHAEARFVPIDGYPDESHALWRIPADLAFPCATQNELTGPMPRPRRQRLHCGDRGREHAEHA